MLLLIKDLLNEEMEIFITWEGLGDFEQYFWWIKAFNKAGLYVEWEKRSKRKKS